MTGVVLNTIVPVFAPLYELSLSDTVLPAVLADQIQQWSLIATLVTSLNILLLLGLLAVWGRNYLDLRSKHPLGLAVFAVLLLCRNVWALYIYQFDPLLAAWFASDAVPGIAWQAMLVLHVLETGALAFLAWVTWD